MYTSHTGRLTWREQDGARCRGVTDQDSLSALAPLILLFPTTDTKLFSYPRCRGYPVDVTHIIIPPPLLLNPVLVTRNHLTFVFIDAASDAVTSLYFSPSSATCQPAVSRAGVALVHCVQIKPVSRANFKCTVKGVVQRSKRGRGGH